MITIELYLSVAARLTVGILRVTIYFNKNGHILLKEQKPLLTGMDGTLQCVYREVLELHNKVRGLFKLIRPHKRMINPILFPNAGCTMIEQLQYFHDILILIIITILVGIIGSMYILSSSQLSHRLLTDSQSLERLWTLLPLVVLVSIGLPSLNLLYLIDDLGLSRATAKALGHQWY